MEKIKFNQKSITAGAAKRDKKDGTTVQIIWPANPALKVESLENKYPDYPDFVIATFDAQILQHDASGAWRNCEGDLTKLPKEPTEGKKLWFDGEVIRINWGFKPGESGSARIDQLTETVKKFAHAMSAADKDNPISPAQAVAMMGLSAADQKAVLAKLA